MYPTFWGLFVERESVGTLLLPEAQGLKEWTDVKRREPSPASELPDKAETQL